jgi:hypothetical protein
MGRLTTHILDTTRGGAAYGVALRLYRCGEHREQIADATTNADGRSAPMELLAVNRPFLIRSSFVFSLMVMSSTMCRCYAHHGLTRRIFLIRSSFVFSLMVMSSTMCRCYAHHGLTRRIGVVKLNDGQYDDSLPA